MLDLNLGHVRSVDGAAISLLVALRAELTGRGVRCEIVAVPSHIRPLVHLYGGDAAPAAPEVPARVGPLSRLGLMVARVFSGFRRAVTFLGDTVGALGRVVSRPRTGNWRSVPGLVAIAGTDGVPIVVLLNFLVGFVMGFQSERQLERYGANVYVADVVGISVTRELAPLMTAIIMSGRSGAAFAAELGTMRVSEEIDALRTMGLAPGPFLILPRVAALAIVAPI